MSTYLGQLIISSLLVASVSFIGMVLVRIHPRIRYLVERGGELLRSFSAGIFLVTSFFLAKKALASTQDVKMLALSFTLGVSIYFLLHRALCHGHGEEREEERRKASEWKVLIGDAFHNIADGLILVASFGAGPVFGFGSLFSIIIHELPQEISKFLVLKASGNSDWKASLKSFSSALSIFIGIGIGLLVSGVGSLRAFFYALTSTFFLGVIFHDLFPFYRLKLWRREGKLSHHVVALVLGMLSMLVVAFVIHQVQG